MLTTLPDRVSALLADPFDAAMRELNDEFGWMNGPNWSTAKKLAPLSIWEDEGAFYIDVDVPGVAAEDVDVSLEKGKLSIRGERKPARDASKQLDERCYGQFERTVSLNEWIDPNNIEASLHDGVLQLKLAKRPESQRQKIKISGSCPADAAQHIETDNT